MTRMKRIATLVLLALGSTMPSLMAQTTPAAKGGSRFQAGVFADYFKLDRTVPSRNLVGAGVRAGIIISRTWQLEGETSYDFKRSFTTNFTNGFTTVPVTTRLRTVHALFGPRYEFYRGPVHAFATFKAGVVNFGISDQNAPQGFVGPLGRVTAGGTCKAIYPGGGVEVFAGRIGLRFDVGDEIYLDSGGRNSLKVTFGPQFRF